MKTKFKVGQRVFSIVNGYGRVAMISKVEIEVDIFTRKRIRLC